MKKQQILVLRMASCVILLFSFGSMFGQPNELPPFGLVGIGTQVPEVNLDIDINGYQSRDGGVRITMPNTSPGDGSTNQRIFEIRREFPSPVGGGTFMKTQFLIEDDGQVAIGMGAPDLGTKLQIHEGTLKLTGNNVAGGPMVVFGGSPTSAPYGQWGIEYRSSGTQTGLNFWKPYASNNYGNYFLFLADNGKVSIGLDPTDPNTFNGEYKLYVGTGIMTEKVKIALSTSDEWADYVFQEDYDLMPLDKVEDYISHNGHLPNVPSAQEVVDTGIDVAKMNALLLEKIEELTLYILQQEARIQQLETTVKTK